MTALGLQAVGTQVYRKGRPWRHVGVNHTMLFMQELFHFEGVQNQGLDGDLDAIQARGIDLVRVGFGWFDYIRWRDLYWLNQAQYWATVQRVLDAMAERDMVCIVVMAKGLLSFSQLTHYTTGATIAPNCITDPTSPLRTLWVDYVTEFVTRFKNHPAVGAWSPGNELSAKLGNEYRREWSMNGSVAGITLGNKPEGGTYTTGEHMSQATYVRFLAEFADIVRANDPHARMIVSGDAIGNSFAVGVRRQNSLAADNFADWNGRADTGGLPWVAYRDQSCDVICTHVYPPATVVGDNQFFGDGDRTYRQLIQLHKQWADQVGKPFFLEEFGSTRYAGAVDLAVNGSAVLEAQFFNDAMQSIVDFDVPIACVWNWTGNTAGTLEWQWFELTHPTRTYQLDAIQALNSVRR